MTVDIRKDILFDTFHKTTKDNESNKEFNSLENYNSYIPWVV